MRIRTFENEAEYNFSQFLKNNCLTLYTISDDKERNPSRKADSPSKIYLKKTPIILNPHIICSVNKNAALDTIFC